MNKKPTLKIVKEATDKQKKALVDYQVGPVYFVRAPGRVMQEAPVWETGKGAKNWLARIWRDKGGQGGLGREFVAPVPIQQQGGRDRVEFYDLPDWAVEGLPIEFGADRHGQRYPDRERWYGVIAGIWEGWVALQEYTTARRAIRASEVWGQEGPHDLAEVPTEEMVSELRRRGFTVEVPG